MSEAVVGLIDRLRPEALFSACLTARAEDARRAAEDRAGFVDVDCPACAGSRRRRLFDKYGFEVQQCEGCLTAYVSPRPPFEWLTRFYEEAPSVNGWLDVLAATEAQRRRAQFVPRAEQLRALVERVGAEPSVMMDVGAANGTFCEVVREMGLFDRVIAVDTNARAAQMCREKGLEVVTSPLETLGREVQPGVITAYEVLEHVFDPGAFLEVCRGLLAPGGLLVLTTPNFLGFDVLVMGRETGNVCPPEHLNYFNPQAIRVLLRDAGFRVVEVSTPGSLDVQIVQREKQKGTVDFSSQPFLEYLLSGRLDGLAERFQQFLSENGLSSHMWAVAQKV